MSEVKRYDIAEYGCGMDEIVNGQWVGASDFDRITADIEQRRHAEQQACQTAEQKVTELSARVAKLESDNRSMRALMRKRHKQHESRKQTLRAVVKGALNAEQVKP